MSYDPLATVFGVAAHYTPLINDGRTDHDVLDHMKGEVKELSDEIDDPTNPGEDGIFGEAIDIMACCVDIIRRHFPDLSEEELECLAVEKMREKCEKWKRKAEAGLYPYQQR
jgi:hypothetical protein